MASSSTMKHGHVDLHVAAPVQVRSDNLRPFISDQTVMRIAHILFWRTSRPAGLTRMLWPFVFLALWVFDVIYLPTAVVVIFILFAVVNGYLHRRCLLPRPWWMDPGTVGINRLRAHTPLVMYESFEAAVARDRKACSNIVSLDGIWDFLMVSCPDAAPQGFQNPNSSQGTGAQAWSQIKLPSHWQLEPASGATDTPIYSNTNYPFPNRPPYIPKDHNPTGLYRRTFRLPRDWDVSSSRIVLVFQGVDSALTVWVNGHAVGYSQDSRLPAEFDVTDALGSRPMEQEHTVVLRVLRYCDGSYMEDQDHWWLSGVHRSVELVRRPAHARISDVTVRTSFCYMDSSGNLEVEVEVEGDAVDSLDSNQTPHKLPDLTVSCTIMVEAATASAAASGGSGMSQNALSAGNDSGGAGGGGTGATGGGGGLGGGGGSSSRLSSMGESMQELGHRIGNMVSMGSAHNMQLLAAAEKKEKKMEVPLIGSWIVDDGTGDDDDDGEDHELEHEEMTAAGGGGGGLGCTKGKRTKIEGEVYCARKGRGKRRGAAWVYLFRLELPTVKPWSAEQPNLYTLVTGLQGQADTIAAGVVQYESTRVGFRTVEVKDGQLLVNNAAIMVAGVNRHEHDPTTGKVISEDSMRRDILLLKRNNFNAARNCHYPNHWRWYELCNEMGLYLCDEANLETHGQLPLHRLSSDPAWEGAYVSRIARMVRNNKNHPCIILWSLGNESGDGQNLLAGRLWIKRHEPSRPVQYEGGGQMVEGTGCTKLTDIVCPMYPTPQKALKLGTDGPGGVGESRPVIPCEYSHAMGNSSGNLHEYWHAFWTQRRMQGGFIWDMVDQGLEKIDKRTGKKMWVYGGGFGDKESAGYETFCCNGLVLPDRTPKPALFEAKYLMQPIGFTLLSQGSRDVNGVKDGTGGSGSGSGSSGSGSPGDGEGTSSAAAESGGWGEMVVRLQVTNRYSFRDLKHLTLTWTLKSDKVGGVDTFIRRGTIVLPKGGVRAGSSCEVTINCGTGLNPMAHVDTSRASELFLNVTGALDKPEPWADAGHVVVEWQTALRLPSKYREGGDSVRSSTAAWAATQAQMEVLMIEGFGAGRERSLESVTKLEGGGGLGFSARRSRSAERGSVLDACCEQPLLSSSSSENSPAVARPSTIRSSSSTGTLATATTTAAPAAATTSAAATSQPPSTTTTTTTTVAPHDTSSASSVSSESGKKGNARHMKTSDDSCEDYVTIQSATTGTKDWEVTISRLTGRITRYRHGGKDLINSGQDSDMEGGAGNHCFWRAATENDRAGYDTILNFVMGQWASNMITKMLPLDMKSYYERWRQMGIQAHNPPRFQVTSFKVTQPKPEMVTVVVKWSCMAQATGRRVFKCATAYRIYGNGMIAIECGMTPTVKVPSCWALPRVGQYFQLVPGLTQVKWFGKGPHECYSDRKSGAFIDTHQAPVDALDVPYIRPGETGGRTDCRWVTVTDESGRGVLVKGAGGLNVQFSASLYSAKEKEMMDHYSDLPEREKTASPVHLYVDAKHMGVGGDNTWLPDLVHEEYIIPAEKTSYTLWICPLKARQLPQEKAALCSLLEEEMGVSGVSNM